MQYSDALRFLESFIDYEKIAGSYYTPEREHLASMRRLLELTGHPEDGLVCVHLAGTKGKGSTAAMLASILTAAGYRTGLYTSPHLIDFRERIQVDGEPISRDDCAAQVEALAGAANAVRADSTLGELSFFELYTALAFRHFRAKQVDLAVLETGLGGRLDATNTASPLACGITLIGKDHEAVLGDTIALIAAEKAGILKPGVPAIVAPQPPEAADVIRAIAADRAAPLIWVRWAKSPGEPSADREIVIEERHAEPEAEAFTVRGLRSRYVNLRTPLLGAHQVVNAATAVGLAELAGERLHGLPDGAVAQGLADVRWQGRFELLGQRPWIVLDGAHNRESAQALTQTLEERLRYERLIVVFGGMGDHALRRVAEPILPRAAHVIFTRSKNPRAADPGALKEQLTDLAPEATVEPTVRAALERARNLAAPRDAILVTGSLYIVGEALEALEGAQ